MTIHPQSTTADQAPKERLEARYGSDPAFVPPSWNSTVDILLNHRSSRAYLDKQLPEGTVELLVAAAQSAPTSSNLQAWSVVAVENPQRKARLADYAGPNPQIVAAPLFLVWLIDLSRLRAIAKDNGNEGEGLDYLESFLLGAIDAALAAQNAVTVLESLGLGSCYIGAIRNRPEDVARELSLPPETVAVFGLTVGYPDPAVETDVKPRLPQRSVLFRETYGTIDSSDFEAYNKRFNVFREKQNLPQAAWTTTVAHRLENADALKGRAELTATLRRLGFPVK